MHLRKPKITYKDGTKTHGYRRKYIEEEMQFAVIRWANYHPICKDYLFHIANERRCTEKEGARFKALGVKSGIWDLFLPYPNKTFPGLWIELKVNDNKLTPNQIKWGALMKLVGYATAVVYDDWEKVKILIEQYLNDDFSML